MSKVAEAYLRRNEARRERRASGEQNAVAMLMMLMQQMQAREESETDRASRREVAEIGAGAQTDAARIVANAQRYGADVVSRTQLEMQRADQAYSRERDAATDAQAERVRRQQLVQQNMQHFIAAGLPEVDALTTAMQLDEEQNALAGVSFGLRMLAANSATVEDVARGVIEFSKSAETTSNGFRLQEETGAQIGKALAASIALKAGEAGGNDQIYQYDSFILDAAVGSKPVSLSGFGPVIDAALKGDTGKLQELFASNGGHKGYYAIEQAFDQAIADLQKDESFADNVRMQRVIRTLEQAKTNIGVFGGSAKAHQADTVASLVRNIAKEDPATGLPFDADAVAATLYDDWRAAGKDPQQFERSFNFTPDRMQRIKQRSFFRPRSQPAGPPMLAPAAAGAPDIGMPMPAAEPALTAGAAEPIGPEAPDREGQLAGLLSAFESDVRNEIEQGAGKSLPDTPYVREKVSLMAMSRLMSYAQMNPGELGFTPEDAAKFTVTRLPLQATRVQAAAGEEADRIRQETAQRVAANRAMQLNAVEQFINTGYMKAAEQQQMPKTGVSPLVGGTSADVMAGPLATAGRTLARPVTGRPQPAGPSPAGQPLLGGPQPAPRPSVPAAVSQPATPQPAVPFADPRVAGNTPFSGRPTPRRSPSPSAAEMPPGIPPVAPRRPQQQADIPDVGIPPAAPPQWLQDLLGAQGKPGKAGSPTININFGGG